MTLRQQLIRLASADPVLRPYLIDILCGGFTKDAGKSTADFVLWALGTQNPISTDRVIRFLEHHGIEMSENTESKRGLPIEVGETVEIQATNAPAVLQDLLQPFHLSRGRVVSVRGLDIVIQILGGSLLSVPGGAVAGKSSGVYRTSMMEEDSKAKHIEVVYLPANERKPSSVAVEVLRQYVERGLASGEERSENYFSGFTSSWKMSKQEHPYFMMFSQQRGGRPRTLSPDKGHVYYIGIIGKRPPNWVAELQALGV